MRIRVWNVLLATALCAAPALAQMPAGGAGGAGTQQQQPMGGANAGAQQQMNQMGTNSGDPNGAALDKAFIGKALEGNEAEVQMGQLALQKSNDEQIKQFAQRMVDDHGKLQDELKPIAEQMNVKVPDQPSKSAMKKMDKMKALSGEAFDQAYVKDMVKDHKNDENDFKQEAQSTQNPQLKQFAMKGHQVIQSHLEAIEQIAKSKGTAQKSM